MLMKTTISQLATNMMITRSIISRLARALREFVLSMALLLVLAPAIIAGWTPLAHTAPGGVGLMLLLSDGTVMAASRVTDPNEMPTSSGSRIWYRLTPVNGSYVNGTWTTLSPMLSTRLWYSSVVLRDGRVLIAGGEYGTGGATAEVYDPVLNQWTSTPAPGATLSDSVSKILRDGRVLVGPATGGITLIYAPWQNTWSPGPTPQGMANQNEVTWLKLPDDSILTVPTNSLVSQRFLQTTNQWITDGNVGVNLYSSVGSETGGAFLLPDGRAFFLGGDSTTALYTPSGNNNPGTWVQGPNIPNVRDANNNLVAGGAPDAGAAMMVNGRILCAFSPLMFPDPNDPTMNIFPTPTSFAIYDPVANSFTTINGPTGATVNVPAYQNLMLALPNGTVLYSNFGNQLYAYAPDFAPAPLAAGKPTITSITANADGSYHLIGTKLNGISEGASYGDDAQMDSNYPLVRLIDSGGNVRYGRTFNWSSTSVMTGNTPVTTEFTLPDIDLNGGVTGPGIYNLAVVANGISSDLIQIAGPIWVDFNYVGVERGSFAAPYKTLGAALNAAISFPVAGRTIRIKGPGSSPETFTSPPISIPVTIISPNGTATIGH
ncbi:MAG: hypothetical protein JST85_28540 [Acidobacteria bacterium]|nr:hypothetical protein [Acidobacteriota bacterium]